MTLKSTDTLLLKKVCNSCDGHGINGVVAVCPVCKQSYLLTGEDDDTFLPCGHAKFHEAVTEIPCPDCKGEGTITETVCVDDLARWIGGRI